MDSLKGQQSDSVLLRFKLSVVIAMILGGVVITYIGCLGWMRTGGYLGIFPAVIGILGLLMSCSGILQLALRNPLSIVISDSAIDLPSTAICERTDNRFQKEARRLVIPRESIAMISKHESFKGRLIEITTKDQNTVLVEARHYCSLNQFISHCRSHGLLDQQET
jgi:hypothetical protein